MPRKQSLNARRRAGWPAALLLAVGLAWASGCGKDVADSVPVGGESPPMEGAARPTVRKEFVILQELVKQHGLQREAGNEVRVETIKRHLREWLEKIPDNGTNEAERGILEQARALAE